MPAEIKFTSFGIPYLVEFANVSIRSPASVFKKKGKAKSKTDKLPPTPGPVRCPTCGHHPHAALSAKGGGDAKDHGPRPGGLYIRFGSEPTDAAPSRISDRRLARLRRTIAEAVTNAGMSTPPTDENLNATDATSPLDGRAAVRSTESSKQALFKGTYGQVKEALKNAGLITTPCAEGGFENATRLGALFVVNSKGQPAGLEFTKLTLWG